MGAMLRRIIIMKRKGRKRLGVLILCITLIVGLFPNMPGKVKKVKAATLSLTQFATRDQLLSNFKLDVSAGSNIGKLRFGAGGRTWFIAGAEDSSTLALLSASSFGSDSYGSDSKYSTSLIRNILYNYTLDDTTTYFSASEKVLMKETTVSTLEWDQADWDEMRKVSGKLYIPDAYDCMSNNDTKIYVGSNNNIEISLYKLALAYGFSPGTFWLRSPYEAYDNKALVAIPNSMVDIKEVSSINQIVPAFHLDMSSVLFASATLNASSDGFLPIRDSMVIRYASTALGTATISNANTSIAVKGTGEKTYLVVQNAEGAWAKDVSSVSGTSIVPASDITIAGKILTSFSDCKVWLETTDATERITTATMAVWGTGYHVVVTPGSNMTRANDLGETVQTDVTGAMTNVVYTADKGYYFPEDYSVTGISGVTVTRNTDTMITVSGVPTTDVTITLISPTKKAEQAAPAGLSDGFNKILGTTTEMEYAASVDASTWTTCSNGSTEVPAGTWYVRYRETSMKEAGVPASITVTISIPKYTVTVNNGTGDGQYEAGETVSLMADTAPPGKQFTNWTVVSGGVTIANTSNATTTFTMPAKAVEVTANYEDVIVENAPSISLQPADATIQERNTATFTMAATGTEPLRYQWKIDKNDGNGWVNVSGAIGPTYTISAVDMSYNGCKFKCVVTNSVGSVESKSVILTVTNTPVEKYTVTVTNDGNGTAYANVKESVPGSKVSIITKANVGYEFKEWQVISGGVTVVNSSFVMPSNDVVIKAFFVQKETEETKDYEIMEGQNQTVVLGNNNSVTIRVNGDFSKFVSVALDRAILSNDYYIAQSGSTIITLKPEFIETLSLGKHTITVNFTDGTAQTSLVSKKTESKTEDTENGKDDVPKTGEDTKAGWLYVLALISSGALVASSLKIRKIKLGKK